MANRERGEVTVTLCDKKYTLRPTFEAMSEIEDRLDMSISELISKLQSGGVRLKYLRTIVWAGMYGFDKEKAPSEEEVGELIRTSGITELLTTGIKEGKNPIVMFLIKGILGDKSVEEVLKNQEKSGNPKVEPEKK